MTVTILRYTDILILIICFVFIGKYLVKNRNILLSSVPQGWREPVAMLPMFCSLALVGWLCIRIIWWGWKTNQQSRRGYIDEYDASRVHVAELCFTEQNVVPIAATVPLVSQELSEDNSITPPEHRPERRIVLLAIYAAIPFAGPVAIIAAIIAIAGFGEIVGWISNSMLGQTKALLPDDYKVSVAKTLGQTYLKVLLEIGVGAIVFLLVAARRLGRKSADHLVEHDTRPPIIYLRSFADDELTCILRLKNSEVIVDFEHALSHAIFRFGPFVALGRPSQWLPPFGAARTYPDNSVWKKKVTPWMERASCIVCMPGLTPSLQWEISELQRLSLVQKTIFIFPPVKFGTQSRRWSMFLAALDDENLRAQLANLDTSSLIATWIAHDGVVTLVHGRRGLFQEYEMACRLALFELRVGPSPETAQPQT